MKNKILFVVSLLFGLMFINAGLNKFFMYFPPPQELVKVTNTFTEIKWLMPLAAIAEIIGGILVMTNKYRALGAIIIFPAMIGILLFHLISDPSGIIMAVILMGINLWILFENRAKYMPMIK